MSHTPIDDFGVLRRLLMQNGVGNNNNMGVVLQGGQQQQGLTPPLGLSSSVVVPAFNKQLSFPPLFKDDDYESLLMRDLLPPPPPTDGQEEELWKLLSSLVAASAAPPEECSTTPNSPLDNNSSYSTPSKTTWQPVSPPAKRNKSLCTTQNSTPTQIITKSPKTRNVTTPPEDWSTRPPAVLAHPDEFVNPSSFLKVYGDPLCGSTDKKGALLSRGKCGNWPCNNCGNVNYPRRFRCNKCGQRRSQDGDSLVASYALEVYQQHLKAFRSRKTITTPVEDVSSSQTTVTPSQTALSISSLNTIAIIEPQSNKRVPKLPLNNIDNRDETTPATARPFWRNELSWSAVVRGHNTARCDADPSWRTKTI